MKKRIFLDMAMLLSFVILLDYRYIHNLGHEVMALLFAILFIFHTLWNKDWYANLKRGRWNGFRQRLTLLNLLLLLAFLAVMVTGIFISHHLYFMGYRFPLWVHRLHRIAGFSMLILIGLHLGQHWQPIGGRLKKKFPFLSGPLRYPFLLALAAGGIYFSFFYHIGGRLLLIPLSQLGRPPVTLFLFVFAHLLIIALYAIVGCYGEKLLQKKKSH